MTYKNNRKIDIILNLTQNSTSMSKVLASVRRKLVSKSQFFIYTPNPEIILLALKSAKLASILISSDILVNDGIGLSMAYDFLSKKRYKNKLLAFFIYLFQGLQSGYSIVFSKNKKVVKGRDLFMELMKLGNKLGWKVFLLGGKEDEAKKTKEKLEVSLKKIQIKTSQGPILNENGIPFSRKEYEKEKKSIEMINAFKPDLLFVAFGAPKQEFWISKNVSGIKTRGVMSVGGTFRYVSGKMNKPSKLFENAGLEWLWRLIFDPKRIVRIFRAVIIFPLEVYLYKLSS